MRIGTGAVARAEVEERLGGRTPGVEHVEGPTMLGIAPNCDSKLPNPERGKVDALPRFADAPS
jgi:hypothetical protein